MKKTKMLKKNYEFNKIFTNGHYYFGKTIEAFLIKNKKNFNYLGVAVGTKSGKACKRNRVKRLLRENYKLLENNIENGWNIIFLWKKKCNIESAEFSQIQQDMIKIFKDSKIYIEE